MDAVVVELGKCNEYLPLYVFCTWLSMYSATAVRATKVTNVRLNRAPLVFIREEKIVYYYEDVFFLPTHDTTLETRSSSHKEYLYTQDYLRKCLPT